MNRETDSPKRNLFEIDNARNLSRQELVDTFVPTQSFWRLLSAKHHVVLGSRGSGKTALAKMLSHDHLSLFDDDRARATVQAQDFIGVYIPTRLEWVGGLKNKPWQSEEEKELFFQWRLNLSSCIALLATIESCVRVYSGDRGQQARVERELALLLSNAWLDEAKFETFDGIKRKLEDIEYSKHQEVARARATGSPLVDARKVGPTFDTDLFVPMKRGITLATRSMAIKPTCTWLVCVDEAEFLEESQHRILNSYMRAFSENNVFYKITTMPYCHYTRATNTSVSLDVGNDFDYIYIDADPVLIERTIGEKTSFGTQFPRKLFSMRVEASDTFPSPLLKGEPMSIVGQLLGRSKLLDDKDDQWPSDSENFELLRKHASHETVLRAERLVGKPEFLQEISRKIHGALLLREAYSVLVGNAESEIYSGASLVFRCGDANPRRLIRIFNALILAIGKGAKRGAEIKQISRKNQNRILRRLSTSALARVQSEPKIGHELYTFIDMIGGYMHSYLHRRPLTTDQVTSIVVDGNVSDVHWEFIQRCVQLGCLYPTLGVNSRDEMPEKSGTFRLGYILAPHFFVLPRRGKAQNLSTILKEIKASGGEERRLVEDQIPLL